MKISKYTFFFDVDTDPREFYIYSTLSNALIEIDEDSYLYLSAAQKSKSEIDLSEIDDELYGILTLKRFIVENDIDSFLHYKSILTAQRQNKSSMHLTIAPTMDCCFECHYCFEKYKGKNYMSEDVMDSIIKRFNLMNPQPEIGRLTWFGGEPLMALTQMEQFYDKLVTGYKKPRDSNVITTGFHINEEAIRVMKYVGVSQVQITLDGLKDTHNGIKYTENCNDAFGKVMDNCELLFRTSDIHVVFRVNVTKQNASEYVELYHYLINRFRQYKRFGVGPGIVMDRGACSSNADISSFFSMAEATKFVLELYNKYNIHTPSLHYPSRFFTECAIRNEVAMSFDPEGYAYKCWEVIGNKEYAVGKLDKDGKMVDINQIVLNRQLYGADPIDDKVCSACRYLPICNGGCPIQRIQNVFEERKNCNCTLYKGHMEDFLKIHLKLKKAGVRNKRD